MLRASAVMALIATFVLVTPAAARKSSLIRDAEIEDTIRAYTTPLFAAAGLDASVVEVHIVNSPDLNAFVTGGQKIFVFTGLLQASTAPAQIIGVIAHETGHIMGGHLARTQEALRAASSQSIITMLLGVAAIVAGQGDAGTALIVGGQQVGLRGLLKYSRSQESAADQAALKLLEATRQSARGLADFLDILGDQEALLPESQDPYVRSHPMTGERIAAVQRHLERSPYSDVGDSPEFLIAHERMKAKLMGYLRPARALRLYPNSDDSVGARYARAIAYHRLAKLNEALAEIDGLIAEFPNDPYFHELRGDMLTENQRVTDATAAYRRAVTLQPNSPLLLLSLARVQIALGDAAQTAEAIAHLENAIRFETANPNIWRQLAIGYGRSDDIGMASLASAEEHFLLDRHGDARRSAERAEHLLPRGSPAWLRSQDILSATRDAETKRER